MLVVCNGMMRSASTLQYNLVCDLVESTRSGSREGFFWKDQLEVEEARLVGWAVDDRHHVIKSHWLVSLDLTVRSDVRICYTYRNLLDVASSLMAIRNPTVPPEEHWKVVLHHLDEAVSTFYTLKELPDVVWQRYEEMVVDQKAATRRIAVALALPAPDALIAAVSDRWRIESTERKTARILRRQHRRRRVLGWMKRLHMAGRSTRTIRRFRPGFTWEPDVDEHTLLRADHVSATRGAAGTWRTGLAGAEVDTIVNRYESWFADAGYGPESTDSPGGS